MQVIDAYVMSTRGITQPLSDVISAKARNVTIAAMRVRHLGTWTTLYSGWRAEFSAAGLPSKQASILARSHTVTDLQELYPEEWTAIRAEAMAELKAEHGWTDSRPAANKIRHQGGP